MTSDAIDVAEAVALAGRISEDFAGSLVMALAFAGDRLGLFQTLADLRPRTAAQLAEEAGLNERYVREWASALTSSGYVTYDSSDETFRLTAAQAAVLTDADSPFYLGGSYLYAQACVRVLPELIQAFRTGDGVPFSRYGPEISEAIGKLFANGYRDAVATQWILTVSGLSERLRRGGRVAEVGCGGGHALLTAAAAFPESTFLGCDLDEPSLERARARAAKLEAGTRVSFERRAAEDLAGAGSFDLIMAFNCIHDMSQPVAALSGVRAALAEDGWFLWSEVRLSDRLEENHGPLARGVYAASCMHCMPVALVDGGAGLGTVVGEDTVRDLATKAGFAARSVLDVEHPYHRLYVLTK